MAELTETQLEEIRQSSILEDAVVEHIDHLFSQSGQPGESYHWLHIAKTDVQKAFMCIRRAIARSQRITDK